MKILFNNILFFLFFFCIINNYYFNSFFIEAIRCSNEIDKIPKECQTMYLNNYQSIAIINDSLTIEQITQQANILLKAIAVTQMNPNCRTSLITSICSLLFPPCSIIQTQNLPNFLVFGVPTFGCRSLCYEVERNCGSSFIEQNFDQLQALLNCSIVDNSSNIELFPEKSIVISISSTNQISIPCNNASILTYEQITLEERCVDFVKLDQNWFTYSFEAMCRIPCPLPIYTESEWTTLIQISFIATTISLFAIPIAIITFISISEFRKYPTNAIIALLIGLLLAYIPLFIFYLLRNVSTDLLCVNEFEELNMHNFPFCAFQGSILVLGVMATLIYFCIILSNLFALIIFKIAPSKIAKLKYTAHLIAWIFPIILIILILATDSYEASVTGCIVEGTVGLVVYIFFFLFTFCGLVLTIILTLCMILIELNDLLFQNLGLPLVVLICANLFLLSTFFYFYLHANNDKFRANSREYIECQIFELNDCNKNQVGPNFQLNLAVVFLNYIIPFIISTIIISKLQYFYHWKRLIYYIVTLRWNRIKQSISTGSSTK
eukprot:TRINITY_DN857_c2_g1_i4.p1 TRINITY_DN857_c2_g1~~TRINITY_DN857_c2_g1_i4.p1  ORF type:complete len:550 (-),score=131.99 TRINITY_DN857_c2_g1_i4:620-2269(-)